VLPAGSRHSHAWPSDNLEFKGFAMQRLFRRYLAERAFSSAVRTLCVIVALLAQSRFAIAPSGTF